MRYLPLVVGPAVLVAIFFFADLSFHDETFEGTLVELELERGVIGVERDGKGALTLPLEAAPALVAGGEYAAEPAAALGEHLSYTSHGIISQVERVGLASVALVVLLTLLALVLQAWRLALLYSSGSQHATWAQAFRAHLIGLLYGNVLPAGQVGGDPIKAFYLARLAHGRRTHAFAAVLIDRALGLAVLAAIAVGAIVLGFVEIGDSRIRWLILIVLGGGMLATLALLSSRLRRAIGVSALIGKLPLTKVREKIRHALADVSASPRILAAALGISMISHLLLIAAVFVVSEALGLALPFGEFIAKVPVANIVASLPLAPPGGWGFGEWAYMMLFTAVSAEAAFALSALPRLAMLFLSLWGVVASWKLPSRQEVKEALSEDQEPNA